MDSMPGRNGGIAVAQRKTAVWMRPFKPPTWPIKADRAVPRSISRCGAGWVLVDYSSHVSRHDEFGACVSHRANRLQRHFTVARPNAVWVSDVTYLWTQSGWLYLVIFLDLYSRKVVGWALSRSLEHAFVLKALLRACANRQPPQGRIIHSDWGVQYACTGFIQERKKRHFVQSMSRKGACWDNSVAESFFHLLKTEWVYHAQWMGYAEAHQALFEYIEIFYKRERSHSTLGYLTPAQFEQGGFEIAA